MKFVFQAYLCVLLIFFNLPGRVQLANAQSSTPIVGNASQELPIYRCPDITTVTDERIEPSQPFNVVGWNRLPDGSLFYLVSVADDATQKWIFGQDATIYLTPYDYRATLPEPTVCDLAAGAGTPALDSNNQAILDNAINNVMNGQTVAFSFVGSVSVSDGDVTLYSDYSGSGELYLTDIEALTGQISFRYDQRFDPAQPPESIGAEIRLLEGEVYLQAFPLGESSPLSQSTSWFSLSFQQFFLSAFTQNAEAAALGVLLLPALINNTEQLDTLMVDVLSVGQFFNTQRIDQSQETAVFETTFDLASFTDDSTNVEDLVMLMVMLTAFSGGDVTAVEGQLAGAQGFLQTAGVNAVVQRHVDLSDSLLTTVIVDINFMLEYPVSIDGRLVLTPIEFDPERITVPPDAIAIGSLNEIRDHLGDVP